MKDFLLFIDTEGSGLPKKWDLPYSAEGNWPHSVQVSWAVYTSEGKQIKQEDHYIKNEDFSVEPSATKVHGITETFLQNNGKAREEVMHRLKDDLQLYKPLVVGHFIELDAHMIAADLHRIGSNNPMLDLPSFCTMLFSKNMVVRPGRKYMMLGDLYWMLFKKELQNQHNALIDALATAECFFELKNRGAINDDIIQNQKLPLKQPKPNKPQQRGCMLFLSLLLFTLLILVWL